MASRAGADVVQGVLVAQRKRPRGFLDWTRKSGLRSLDE